MGCLDLWPIALEMVLVGSPEVQVHIRTKRCDYTAIDQKINLKGKVQAFRTNPPLGDNPIGEIAIPHRNGSTDPRETAPHAEFYNEFFVKWKNQT